MFNEDVTPPHGTFAAAIAAGAEQEPAERKNVSTNKRTKKRTSVRSNDGSNVSMNGRSSKPSSSGYVIGVPAKREKVRASFDIFKDQQAALDKLQLAAVDAGHEKPKLGSLIQEAIDFYVRHKAKKLGNITINEAKK